MALHILIGGESHSAFRIERLLETLKRHGAEPQSLRIVDFFLVDADPAIDLDALARLLDAAPGPLPGCDGAHYVVPRLGTLSPWASKAIDIARVCGVAGVSRIERGRALLPAAAMSLTPAAAAALHDPMTESLLAGADGLQRLFAAPAARPLRTVDVLGQGRAALEAANGDWGLALSPEEIEYLGAHFLAVGKNPTDAELMMFAQVNSEHCRHKIFNAEFTVDGEVAPHSLFGMIRLTHKASPDGVLSAYSDNSAVIEGPAAMRWFADADHIWRRHDEPVHILMKVETHNHPTGISPHAGAATGAGGEIRDEAATGRGAKPKAGLCGFTVANLRVPGFVQPWEAPLSRPARMASALSIMLEAPIGAAAYNNEFGRPNLAGYFRTFEAVTADGRNRGYHKPIMIAGGYGNIRAQHVDKLAVVEGAPLIVLGGPAMLIGLGGGAASSMATGTSSEALDFASVQRANPELERRCQEVIDACWVLGAANPILSIHDVGAGGISNALPELVHADGRGGRIRLRDVNSADASLSPMEIWCNESQERYVIALKPDGLPMLEAACARERCPFAVVGTATAEPVLIVEDAQLGDHAVDMPMPVLLGKAPRMQRETHRAPASFPPFDTRKLALKEAAERVLKLPAVASKSFLITIGDRTVGGLTVRDQMVGPWQVPVADCAVTATGFESATGEAMAMGERPLLALLDGPSSRTRASGGAAASARMAVGEAITNIAAANIARLSDIRLSANWMAACGQFDEDARLFDAVKAVGMELCPALGIAIPVGKDSLSMKSVWNDGGVTHTQTAPVSLIVSAFAPVADVRRSLTPQLKAEAATRLVLIDLGNGRNRLGGSALAQVYGETGDVAPDLDDPAQLKAAFALIQRFNVDGRLLAYHDRSDGGLFATVCEMAFAGHAGAQVELRTLGDDAAAALFNEELGMVLQVRVADLGAVLDAARAAGLNAHAIGEVSADDRVSFQYEGREVLGEVTARWHATWAETSHRLARLRDNPACAEEEFEQIADYADPGLGVRLTFDPAVAPAVHTARPRVAILREQGVNGQAEMAYAFDAAGFESVDVHMSDLIEGRTRLDDFAGFAACGGFSYGDVLGAGIGWASSILFHARVREQFAAFLAREDRFALGVCNGCQMMAALKDIVPGAASWPAFRRNRSEQYEARWGMVEIAESRSLFFAGMAGSRMPIAVAHGEGRAVFAQDADRTTLTGNGQVALRFITPGGRIATRYPQNPNGSPEGIASVCNADGRVTILMPHPERTLAGTTGSWWPQAWNGRTPWFRMFENARKFAA